MGLTQSCKRRNSLLLASLVLAGLSGALGSSLPSTSPSPGRGGGGGSQAAARLGASQCKAGVGGQPIRQGGGQSILLSPFSCSAISCPAPAPGMFHLLLLNHFLFTACLLQPPSSSSSQQPSQSSQDGCLDRGTRLSWVRRAILVLPFRQLNQPQG